MDLTFTKYDSQKGGEQITGYSIPEINKNIKSLIYRKWDCQNRVKILLLNLLVFSHCKVSCDSPCCVKLCGDEGNHCNCNIDTHGTIDSDEEEQIEQHL